MKPPIPAGIARDHTEYGEEYYTYQQMREYAQTVLDAQPKAEQAPKREWVGLTDEEAVEVMRKVPHLTIGGLLSVEAKLKEKNT